jgi:hypothetical protein
MDVTRRGTHRSSNAAIAVWLAQLILPTAALVPVAIRLKNHEALGHYSAALLGIALVWYALCFVMLKLTRTRLWIVTHPAQLVCLFASTALALAAAEIVCRHKIARRWRGAGVADPRTQYSPELGWRLVPGQDGVAALGWRGPALPACKAKGRFRVVCVGDSTTYGKSCSWEDSWPHQMEALLNADPVWTEAHGVTEVVNLGVLGYGTDQELLALKNQGLRFQPDLVILHLCVNDFSDISNDYNWMMWNDVTRYKPYFELEGDELALKRDHAPVPRYPSGRAYDPGRPPSLGPWPGLVYAIGQIIENGDRSSRRNSAWLPIRTDTGADYARARRVVWALAREMARASSKVGSRFLVSLSPTLMNAAEDVAPYRVGSFLRDYEADAAHSGLPAIHCVAEYFAEGGNDRFISAVDPYHLNVQGNSLVAQHTVRWLQQNLVRTR